MLLATFAVAAGVIAGLVLGGRIRHLAGIRLRGWWFLVAGSGCQLAGSWWGSGGLGLAVLIVGYALLLCFAAANRARTGMVLVAVGLLANLAVIALDGGMPVRGLPAGAAHGPRHHRVRSGDHLTALADDIHISALGETVSPGDVVLSIGVATTAAGLLAGPRRRPRVDSVASDS